MRCAWPRGTGPGPAGLERLTLDATDLRALVEAASGSDVVVNALNPPYTKWGALWPPMAHNLLVAAETTGAGLLTIGNLYGYGRPTGAMTETSPIAPRGAKGRVRARMWADALAVHAAGKVRAVELRASDYFGPGPDRGMSVLNTYVITAMAAGRTPRVPMGDPQAPHSWTFLPDIAALALAVVEADRGGPDWGRVWHVPTAEPWSMAQVADEVATLTGKPTRGVRCYPRWVMALARVSPMVRELDETRHQFEHPFVLDSSAAQARFGLAPTPWPDALSATIGLGAPVPQ